MAKGEITMNSWRGQIPKRKGVLNETLEASQPIMKRCNIQNCKISQEMFVAKLIYCIVPALLF